MNSKIHSCSTLFLLLFEFLPPFICEMANCLNLFNEIIRFALVGNSHLLFQTYIGQMIVAVNPFQRLQQYGEQLIPQYRSSERESLPPHLYAIAQNAFR